MKTNLNRKGFCLLFSLFLLAGGGGLYASDYHSMSQVQDNVISVSGTVKDQRRTADWCKCIGKGYYQRYCD